MADIKRRRKLRKEGKAKLAIMHLFKLIGHQVWSHPSYASPLEAVFDVNNCDITLHKVKKDLEIRGMYWIVPQFKIPGIVKTVKEGHLIWIRNDRLLDLIDIQFTEGQGKEIHVMTVTKDMLTTIIKSGSIELCQES